MTATTKPPTRITILPSPTPLAPPLASHTLTFVPGTQKVHLIGGENRDLLWTNNHLVLDIPKWEWHPGSNVLSHDDDGDGIPKRSEHVALLVNNGATILIIGGCTSLQKVKQLRQKLIIAYDIKTEQWFYPKLFLDHETSNDFQTSTDGRGDGDGNGGDEGDNGSSSSSSSSNDGNGGSDVDNDELLVKLLNRRLHSAVWNEKTKEVIIFGGCGMKTDNVGPLFGDVLKIKLKYHQKKQQKQQKQQKQEEEEEEVHSHDSSPFSNLNFCLHVKVMKQNTSSPDCHQANPKQKAPCARYGHSAVLDTKRNRMIIFGGATHDANYCNDVYCLDLENDEWKELICKGDVIPAPRERHSCAIDGDRMYMIGGWCFGGCSPHPCTKMVLERNTFFYLDLKDNTWHVITNISTHRTDVAKDHPTSTGTMIPSQFGRYGHASALCGKYHLIHGGKDNRSCNLEDFFVFHLDGSSNNDTIHEYLANNEDSPFYQTLTPSSLSSSLLSSSSSLSSSSKKTKAVRKVEVPHQKEIDDMIKNQSNHQKDLQVEKVNEVQQEKSNQMDFLGEKLSLKEGSNASLPSLEVKSKKILQKKKKKQQRRDISEELKNLKLDNVEIPSADKFEELEKLANAVPNEQRDVPKYKTPPTIPLGVKLPFGIPVLRPTGSTLTKEKTGQTPSVNPVLEARSKLKSIKK